MTKWIFMFLGMILYGCTLEAPSIKATVLIIGGGYNDPTSGINTYPNLEGAKNDALSMASFFQRQGYEVWLRMDDNAAKSYLYTNLGVSLGDVGASITNRNSATLVQIQSDFAALKDNLKNKDLFIFYYAGHGGNFQVTIPSDGIVPSNYKPDQTREYLMIHESLSTGSFVSSKALSDTALGALLNTLPSSLAKVVIVDACQSGGIIGPSPERWTDSVDLNNPNSASTIDTGDLWSRMFGTQVSRDVGIDNAVVITAASEWELSYESSTYGYLPESYQPSPMMPRGVFTLSLQNGIKGPADIDKDQYVSVDEIYNYSRQYIDKYWNKNTSTNKFSPMISGGRINYVVTKTGQ